MTSEKREYTRKGICIWCLKTKPNVTFYTKPHTIPKKLESNIIGFDICDSCNRYFGSDNNSEKVTFSVDKVFKEFFNVHKFLLTNNKDSNSWRKFKSQFFNYYHSNKTLKLNLDYRRNQYYARELTRKFKRGIYNVFLQEYHRCTKNGLDSQFDRLRQFVRFDKNDIPIYYLQSSNGVRLHDDLNMSPRLPFNDYSKSIISEYGFYHLSLTGLNFFLAVTDKADSNYDYIEKTSLEYIGSGFAYKGLVELKRLDQVDFTLRNWR